MDDPTPEPTRADRRARHRSRRRWLTITLVSAVGFVTAAGVGIAVVKAGDGDANAASTDRVVARVASTTTSSTAPTTTTTTLPALVQPPVAALPPVTSSLGSGSDPAVVQAYQQRLIDLHFDPGAADGSYGEDTSYAVETVQKIVGLPRTGRIGPAEAMTIAAFQYPPPLQPTGEPNRTELDVTKQVLTLYENYQVRLITTTSTGSGQHYCYNSPRENPTRHICEVASTPSGRFTYTRWVQGWDKSPLGQLYQPYYFNGGIAVHGYPSVPTTPASHGCARIPMHIAEYFPTLVKVGDPVYVFGGEPAEVLSSTPINSAPAPAPTVPPATTPPVAPVTPPPSAIEPPATPPAS